MRHESNKDWELEKERKLSILAIFICEICTEIIIFLYLHITSKEIQIFFFQPLNLPRCKLAGKEA